MYDFYFGSKSEIEADEEGFLLGIKRLLPRWVNSIPDSQYLALYQLFEQNCRKQRPVLVETGVGASTIALLHCAMKHDGILYSWDIANPKGAEIRNICTDTLEQHHRKSIWDHWRFVAYSSLSEHLGISILRELDEQVEFCFLDSEHTWRTLHGELEQLKDVMAPGAVVSISSIGLKFGGSDRTVAYAGAKSALETLAMYLARQGAASNVLANVVRAGVIDTPLHAKFPKDLEQRRQLIPLQRLGQPEDVAGMVNYLVSDSGNYITGQLFSVAGGE